MLFSGVLLELRDLLRISLHRCFFVYFDVNKTSLCPLTYIEILNSIDSISYV